VFVSVLVSVLVSVCVRVSVSAGSSSGTTLARGFLPESRAATARPPPWIGVVPSG